jgi:hypothetical protein
VAVGNPVGVTVPSAVSTPWRLARSPVPLTMTSVLWNDVESPGPISMSVTVPGTPFTVPVKVSQPRLNVLASARMIKVPCAIEIPLNVPVHTDVNV